MAEKIGVYIDESSVAPLLNAEELAAYVKEKCGGACPIVKAHKRLSSPDGVAMIKADVDAGELDAVLICGTSPRVDWDVFTFGDKVLVDRVNLREFVTLSYKNPDGSSVAAGGPIPAELRSMVQDYLRMGVVKMQKMNRPNPELPETNRTILVLGGGFTGMNAALAAAGAGAEVILVEKSDKLGGRAAGLYKTFPMNYPYLEATDTGIDRLIGLVTGNSRIKVRLNTTLKLLAGAPAMYEATLASGGNEEKVPVGSVVLAAGWTPMETEALAPFGYGKFKNVVTSAEFEAMVKAGDIKRPSDGKEPKTVVFIQCVGSRDKSLDRPYCSGFCCMYTAKQAILTKDHIPDSQSYVFYMDIRSPGKMYDEFTRRAMEEYGARYIRGRVAMVYPKDGKMIVRGADTLAGTQVEVEADLVVLAAGAEAAKGAPQLAEKLRISYDKYGFFMESHPKLKPVETNTAGVYLAGSCQGPKDIPQSVGQGSAAAAKVLALFSKDMLESDPQISRVDIKRCVGCGKCIMTCPFKAIKEVEFRGQKKAEVIETVCQGCGICTSTCPQGAIQLSHFTDNQILAEVNALCQS